MVPTTDLNPRLQPRNGYWQFELFLEQKANLFMGTPPSLQAPLHLFLEDTSVGQGATTCVPFFPGPFDNFPRVPCLQKLRSSHQLLLLNPRWCSYHTHESLEAVCGIETEKLHLHGRTWPAYKHDSPSLASLPLVCIPQYSMSSKKSKPLSEILGLFFPGGQGPAPFSAIGTSSFWAYIPCSLFWWNLPTLFLQ